MSLEKQSSKTISWPDSEDYQIIGLFPHLKLLPKNLADKLKAYRRTLRLFQKKLVEQLGVNQMTLTGWE